MAYLVFCQDRRFLTSVFEAKLVLGTRVSCASRYYTHIRIVKFSDTTQLCSTEHPVRLQVAVNDDNTLAARLVTLV